MFHSTNLAEFDHIFEALSNHHRREIVYSLALQPYSISQLAQMRDLSLPAIHKHIVVLEKSQLINRRKIGRTNILTLNRPTLQTLHSWFNQFNPHWGHNNETLENYEQFLKGGGK